MKWAGSLCILILLSMLCGCSRPPDPKSTEFFVKWLQNHGESNIVVDAQGVGLAGNPTRLRSSLYGQEHSTNGSFSTEVEFRIRLPDKREIVEYVSGTGNTAKKAEDDAKVNFMLTTFHVVYRSFLNPKDPHQTEEPITINGQPRMLVVGDTMARSQTNYDSPDMFPIRKHFRELLTPLPLSPDVHWIKIVYANHRSKVMLCAVTLDNEDSPQLTEAVKKLPWPTPEEFYMVKQFVVVK